jgi:hypothetical protein
MQLYNVPLGRYTPINPYSSGNYTQFQLDMRRKTEILKYSSNKSSAQTNNLTKRQKFALLARGGIPSPPQSNMSYSLTDCLVDKTLPTPTSSCDVPGPVMYLYADESVPLYNFSDFNTRTYPEFVPTNSDPWQFISIPDVLVYDNRTSNIYYLIINNNIDNPSYSYNITTPIGISISGKVPNNYTPPSDFSGNLEIVLTDASLVIYYSENVVKTIAPVNLTSDYGMRLSIPYNDPSGGDFNAIRFIGNLHFNNIQLYTAPTYVYKFALIINATITPNDTRLINYVSFIANMSTTVSTSVGCTILNSLATDVNIGSSITVV